MREAVGNVLDHFIEAIYIHTKDGSCRSYALNRVRVFLQLCDVIKPEHGPRSHYHDLLSLDFSTVIFDLVALLSLGYCSGA